MHGSPVKQRAAFRSCMLVAACVLITLLSAQSSCGMDSAPTAKTAPAPSFIKFVAPIIQKNCLACHTSAVHRGGLILDNYESLMKGGKHGQEILPHDAKGSRMMAMIEGEIDPQMPLNADPLSAADKGILKLWIDAGAEGPRPGESTPTLLIPSMVAIPREVSIVSPVLAVKYSPDGKLLAAGGYGEVRLIDPSTGRKLANLTGHADYVRSIAFSPDGRYMAAAGGSPQSEGEIKIWDVQSHELFRTVRGHKDCIYSVAWSPDGKVIASGSYDRTVRLWDAVSGAELRVLRDHIDAVFGVAFSPDGKRLASASQDRTVKIWDVATGRRLYTLSDSTDGLTSLAYSPTGERLAAGGYDKTIYVWDLGDNEGHLSQSLIADEESLLGLVWSPDGKTIVTASSDGSMRFRDSKLELTGVIDRQPDWVVALDMSPDGKWLSAGRFNGTLSLYDTTTHKEVRDSTIVFEAMPATIADKVKEAAIH